MSRHRLHRRRRRGFRQPDDRATSDPLRTRARRRAARIRRSESGLLSQQFHISVKFEFI